MESIPEISLIDFSIPQKLCKELLQLCSNKGGLLNSVEVNSPDSSSVVKIFPKDGDLVIKVVEPHYLFKKLHNVPQTEGNVKFEHLNDEEGDKYQLNCLIPFNRYQIAEDVEERDHHEEPIQEPESTPPEPVDVCEASQDTIDNSEKETTANSEKDTTTNSEKDSEQVLDDVTIKEEVMDDSDDFGTDGETSDEDFVVEDDEDWEEIPPKETRASQSKQREKHPRKTGRPRKVVSSTLPTKKLSLRRKQSKPTKQRVKKKTVQAPARAGRKRKSEEIGRRKIKASRKNDDSTGHEITKLKPIIGRPKKHLEFRNLNTLALECKYCNEQYNGVAELINHVSMTHSDKEDFKSFIAGLAGMPYENLFACDLCGMVFRQVYLLRRHVRQEHRDDDEFESYLMKLGGKMLPRKIQRTPGKNDIKCKFCSMSSPTGFDVYEHTKRKHSNEAEYEAVQKELADKIKVKCDLCDKTFINPKYIYTHMKLTHCNETHVCDLCGNVFKNKYLLKGHMKAVHDNDKVKLMCDRCPSTFATIHKLQLHIRMVHEKVGQKPCPECGKLLSTDGALKCHVEAVHQRLRPNICEYCGKEFYSGKDLRAHVRVVHEYVDKNFWPHECPVCCRKFADKRNRNKHVQQVHNKVFPFTCEICSKGFPQGKGFRDHVAKHHPQLAEKVHHDAKIKTITAADLDGMPTAGVGSPSDDTPPPQQQASVRYETYNHQSPFPMLQSAMSDQQDGIQQVTTNGQTGVTGLQTSVSCVVSMATTMANSQLMSFESVPMGGRSAPMDNRNVPFDGRNLQLDDRAVHLDARNVPIDRHPHVQSVQTNSVPHERSTHLDNRGMHMNNRNIQLDTRNMPMDSRNIHLDNRNIPLDGRNIHLDGRNIHLDTRNVHIDNRNNAVANYYQF